MSSISGRKIASGLVCAFGLGLLLFSCAQQPAFAAETEAVEQVVSLKDKANEILIDMIEGVQAAGSFLKEEIPIAVKELLTYYTAYYALGLVAGLLFVGAAVAAWFKWLLPYGRNYGERYKKFDEPNFVIPTVFGGLGVLVILCATVAEAFWPLLKITLAPRIWLIEYAADLVR